MVKGQRLPLLADGVGQFGHPVIELRDGDAALIVMHIAKDAGQNPDRVDRRPAIHAGMQVLGRATDR
jgi:hypothetical protein